MGSTFSSPAPPADPPSTEDEAGPKRPKVIHTVHHALFFATWHFALQASYVVESLCKCCGRCRKINYVTVRSGEDFLSVVEAVEGAPVKDRLLVAVVQYTRLHRPSFGRPKLEKKKRPKVYSQYLMFYVCIVSHLSWNFQTSYRVAAKEYYVPDSGMIFDAYITVEPEEDFLAALEREVGVPMKNLFLRHIEEVPAWAAPPP